jgi:hypothetical protein
MEHKAEDMDHSTIGTSKELYSTEDYLPLEQMEHIAEDHADHTTDEFKAEDPLLNRVSLASSKRSTAASSSSPSKSTFTIDEEKVRLLSKILKIDDTENPKNTVKFRSKLTPKERHKRALDLAQRITSLLLSLVILIIMTRAYLTFLSNKDVTADNKSIYPSIMTLWPTFLMIGSAAGTFVLNALIVFWRIQGTIKDLHLEEMYSTYWDYALHIINFVILVATSSTFMGTKYLGGVQEPDVLWGYVCSNTASELSQNFPDIVKFKVECNLQVSFAFVY